MLDSARKVRESSSSLRRHFDSHHAETEAKEQDDRHPEILRVNQRREDVRNGEIRQPDSAQKTTCRNRPGACIPNRQPAILSASLSLWFAFSVAAISLFVSETANAQKFRPDDPIWKDEDTLNIPTPKAVNVADYYDFLENTFFGPGDKRSVRALNINTVGEVPDSSWFTNRHSRTPMTIDQLVRGPDRGGPSREKRWQVIRNKLGGITPGFRVVDAAGTTFQLKFDPLTNPEMATSAEVICTKFFYAIGYFVAEDYLVTFSRNDIELSPKAQFVDLTGKRRPMTAKDVDEILSRAFKGNDGRYRAVASKFIEGTPVGEYRYYGTRPDDPNDIFPHEHRRELRGLRVFSAWLNHDDSRSVNTFNTLVKENGSQFIRHYLFDFGSTLGSASLFAQKPRAGNEYLWEPGPTFKTLFSLGLWVRPWIRVDYPNYPSLGNFEADFFQPEKWKPEYPNTAFNNLTDEDAFWAAKVVMAFSDDQVRAIVKTGQLTDPRAEAYLTETLIKRRDKVGRFWLNQVNPLDQFAVDGNALLFDNAAVRLLKGVPPADSYQAQWHRFDNYKQTQEPVGGKTTSREQRLEIPSAAFEGPSDGVGPYALVEITTQSSHHPSWARPLRVYVRKNGTGVSVVGIERD
jgi:hypothetical protein